MRVPLSWLVEYVAPLPDPEALATRLTMSGLEVEDVVRPDPRLVEGLVVGAIREQGPHPNADRLSLCQVDDGGGLRQVVCGAKNMKPGDKVVLARPSTVLPGGLKIKKSKIRGEESHGMLCSASELGVAEDHDGIMILPDSAQVGAPAAALLGLDTTVLDVAITPNRGDCLSIRGIAREVAAVCGLPLSEAFRARFSVPPGEVRVPVAVAAREQCPMYRGVEVRGVRVAPSPSWLTAKLAACGLRPINNVVDVTNLVLLEYGQPLHAFDADLLAGPRIDVRLVGSELEMDTLDGESRALLPEDLAIWDAEGPVAIAGVMGGARTAVHDGTANVFLESAQFAPGCVRRTSRRLGLVSDSSYRFERGIDPDGVEQALLRAVQLLEEVAGGERAGGVAQAGPGTPAVAPIQLRPARVESLLGIDVETPALRLALEGLGAAVGEDGGDLTVAPPSHRHDLLREVDLIEEIARLRGYESVAEQAPSVPMLAAGVPELQRLSTRIRERLCSAGLSEAVTLAFSSAELNAAFPGLHAAGAAPVVLRNPLRHDAGQMRRSLLPGLFEAARANLRNGVSVVDLFTLGRTMVLGPAGGDCDELEVAAGILLGPRRDRSAGYSGAPTFWDGKGLIEKLAAIVGPQAALRWLPCGDRPEYHPRAAARVVAGDALLGYVGMVHPDAADCSEIPHQACIFEIDTRKLLEYAPPRSALKPIPRFPASSRDVSLLVPDSLPAGNVVAAVEALREPVVESIDVFDEYRGEGIADGFRALAFAIVYRSSERTLTEDEVVTLHESIVRHVVDSLDVEIRS